MSESNKSLLALCFFTIIGFLAFYPALRIGILGDFAGDLYGSLSDWFNFAAYQWNFYVPALAIYYVLYKTFHLSSLPYHVVHLSLIFINAWLVYLLAQELNLEPWQCWVSGLLALFNSSAFETYFWLSTIPKVLATSFGLIALIFLSRFRQRQVSIWGWGYVIMVILGMSLESTGLILPVLGLALDTYYQPWRKAGRDKVRLISGLRLHFWSFGITGIFLLVRHSLGIQPYVINVPLTKKLINFDRTIYNTFFHWLTEGSMMVVKDITAVSIILTLVLCLILGLAGRAKQGSDRRRYITLLLLWVAACLPHTIGANFQPRYLYFPGIFAALVLADLLGTLRLHLHARKVSWLFISLIILGYLSTDLYGFRQYLGYYLEATRIYDAGIKTIKDKLPEMSADTHLVLIDFPGSIKRPRSNLLNQQQRILVYRNALPFHVLLLYKKQNLSIKLVKISLPNGDDNPEPLGSAVSQEQMAKLLAEPQTVAFHYVSGNPGKFVIDRDQAVLPFSFQNQ